MLAWSRCLACTKAALGLNEQQVIYRYFHMVRHYHLYQVACYRMFQDDISPLLQRVICPQVFFSSQLNSPEDLLD